MIGWVDRAEAGDLSDMSRVTINGVVECGESWDVGRWCVEAGARRGFPSLILGSSFHNHTRWMAGAKPVSTGRHNTNSTLSTPRCGFFCLVWW